LIEKNLTEIDKTKQAAADKLFNEMATEKAGEKPNRQKQEDTMKWTSNRNKILFDL